MILGYNMFCNIGSIGITSVMFPKGNDFLKHPLLYTV